MKKSCKLVARSMSGEIVELGMNGSSAKADVLMHIKDGLLSFNFNDSFFDEDGDFNARIYAGGKVYANVYTTRWVPRGSHAHETLMLDTYKFGRLYTAL